MISELLQRGGPTLWLLLACSVIGVGVVLERLLFFHRTRIDVSRFLRGLATAIHRDEYARAVQECAGTPGPAARVLRAAIANRHLPLAELRETVHEASRLELPPTERYLPVLFALIMVTPLIGLHGTVLALLQTFSRLEESSAGLIDSMQLFQGLYEALLSTAVGIGIAIPLYLAYSYLVARARRQLREVERAGAEIIHLLIEPQRAGSLAADQPPLDPPGLSEPAPASADADAPAKRTATSSPVSQPPRATSSR